MFLCLSWYLASKLTEQTVTRLFRRAGKPILVVLWLDHGYNSKLQRLFCQLALGELTLFAGTLEAELLAFFLTGVTA